MRKPTRSHHHHPRNQSTCKRKAIRPLVSLAFAARCPPRQRRLSMTTPVARSREDEVKRAFLVGAGCGATCSVAQLLYLPGKRVAPQ